MQLIQEKPFKSHFETISAKISVGPQYEIDHYIPFLMKNLGSEDNFKPVYREVPVRLDGTRATDFFELTDPDPGEKLVLLLCVQGNNVPKLPDEPNDFGILIERG